MNGFNTCAPIVGLLSTHTVLAVSAGLRSFVNLVDWESEVHRLLAQGKASTLELASLLYTAKAKLRYGHWTLLFQSGRIPFSKRKAEMLVAVGKSMVKLDPQTFAHLPHGWSILYQLSQLNREALEQLIEAGTITPALTLQQAKELVATVKGESPAKRRRRVTVKRWLQGLAGFIRDTAHQWSSQDQKLALVTFKSLLAQISLLPNGEACQGGAYVPPLVSMNPDSSQCFSTAGGRKHFHLNKKFRAGTVTDFSRSDSI